MVLIIQCGTIGELNTIYILQCVPKIDSYIIYNIYNGQAGKLSLDYLLPPVSLLQASHRTGLQHMKVCSLAYFLWWIGALDDLVQASVDSKLVLYPDSLASVYLVTVVYDDTLASVEIVQALVSPRQTLAMDVV